jgi:hypothetical protein
MRNKVRRVISTILFVGTIGFAACSPSSPEELLRSTIERDVRAAGLSLSEVPFSYVRGAERSEVSAVTYHWAIYYPPEVSHGWASAVVVETNQRAYVIRDLEDWSRVLDGGHASSAEEAKQLCAEAVRYAGPRSDPFNLPVVVPPRPPEDARIFWDRAAVDSLVATLSPASARPYEGGWMVDLWAMEMGRTTRYRCSLSGAERGQPPSLAVVDSVPLGLFADEH